MNNETLISIVVPLYNEEPNILRLYEEIRKEMDALLMDFELILVDDGSSDGSANVARAINRDDERVKLISFARNFGHQVALTAGLEHAIGSAAIVMDADLQHPPHVIPRLIEKWKDGYDVVNTIRDSTVDASVLKRLTSNGFYQLINRLIERPIVPNAADFRMMDRKVIDCLNNMPERNRFVRGLISWIGFRQTAIHFVAGKRNAGETKYSFKKMLRFALTGITSFSTKPLRIATYLGFLSALACVPYALWAVYLALSTDAAVDGWASLIVAIIFFGGVQLTCLGIVGEYVGRIYEEVKGRPLYVTQAKVGFLDLRTCSSSDSPKSRASRGTNHVDELELQH